VIIELVTVEEFDSINPGLRDLIEDVASRAAEPDDPNAARAVPVSAYTNGRSSGTSVQPLPGVAVAVVSRSFAG
jgi:hypothetical protein